MTHDQHHEHLIAEVEKLYKPILSKSPQAVYIYLDDEHKTCNKKFSSLLGYKSVKEWVDNEFPVSDVLKKDRGKVIKAYMDASEKFKTTTLSAIWVTKKGEKIKTEVTFTPFIHGNEVFVIHFLTVKK